MFTKEQKEEISKAMLEHGFDYIKVAQSVKSLTLGQVKSYCMYRGQKEVQNNLVKKLLGDFCCWCGLKKSDNKKIGKWPCE